jgi:hypothetical protein
MSIYLIDLEEMQVDGHQSERINPADLGSYDSIGVRTVQVFAFMLAQFSQFPAQSERWSPAV